MGMRPTDAVQFVGVGISTPYARMARNPVFKAQVEQAMMEGQRCLIISPRHWCHPNGQFILNADFEPIPREPPKSLFPWVRGQLLSHPLAALLG